MRTGGRWWLNATLLGLVTALVFLPFGMVLQDVSIRVLTHLHFDTPPQAAIEEFKKMASTGSRIDQQISTAFAIDAGTGGGGGFFSRGVVQRVEAERVSAAGVVGKREIKRLRRFIKARRFLCRCFC